MTSLNSSAAVAARPADSDVLEHNKGLIRRMVDEFVCKGNVAVLAEVCSPTYRFWPVVYTAPEDRDGHARDNAATLHTIFPDLTATIEQQVAEGDWVATFHTLRGTHLAPMPTPLGTIPATGKKLEWKTMSFHRIENGKVAEGWLSYNPTSILQQVGRLDFWPGDPGARGKTAEV